MMTAVEIHNGKLSVNTGLVEQRISSQFQIYLYGMCLNKIERITAKTFENKLDTAHSYQIPNLLFNSDIEQRIDGISLPGGEA